MRISDWSSDVCSSDLTQACADIGEQFLTAIVGKPFFEFQPDRRTDKIALGDVEVMGELAKVRVLTRTYIDRPHHHIFCHENLLRSEEHTSELQSLMRISYAVFCLKKKTKKTQYNKN